MRIYRADGGAGCLVGLLFMMVFFYILLFFSRLLFTTPLGIALLVTFAAWYWFEGRRRRRQTGDGAYEFHGTPQEPERDRANPFEVSDGNGFNRDEVVDVTQYEEVKDDE